MRWLREPPVTPLSTTPAQGLNASPTRVAASPEQPAYHQVARRDSADFAAAPPADADATPPMAPAPEPAAAPACAMRKIQFQPPVVDLIAEARALQPRKWNGAPPQRCPVPPRAPPAAPPKPTAGGMLAPRYPVKLPPLPSAKAAPGATAAPAAEAPDRAPVAPAMSTPAKGTRALSRDDAAARTIQAHIRGTRSRRKLAEILREQKLIYHAVSQMRRRGVSYHDIPMMPVNTSVTIQATPAEANCYERVRDAVLRFFVARNELFVRIAIILLIIFVVDILILIVFFWGAAFGVGIMSPNELCNVNASDPSVTFEGDNQYPPMRCVEYSPETGECLRSSYVATYCNLNQYMFNLTVKVIIILLTYINILPIPWRLAIGIDAWGDSLRRDEGPNGVDFYGRPSESLWFHISRGRRALIALLLNLSYMLHISSLVFAIIFWDYLETQTWPGAFAIGFPGLGSILTLVIAGVLQGNAEAKLIREQPERFPSPVTKYIKEAFLDWKAGRSGKGLLATIRERINDHTKESEQKGAGKLLILTNISLRSLHPDMPRGEYARQQFSKPTKQVHPEHSGAPAPEAPAQFPHKVSSATSASTKPQESSNPSATSAEHDRDSVSEETEDDWLDACCVVC